MRAAPLAAYRSANWAREELGWERPKCQTPPPSQRRSSVFPVPVTSAIAATRRTA